MGLAICLLDMLPMAIAMGFAGALETLVSQYFGKEDYHLCGQFLNKQLILVTIVYLPVAAILFFS